MMEVFGIIVLALFFCAVCYCVYKMRAKNVSEINNLPVCDDVEVSVDEDFVEDTPMNSEEGEIFEADASTAISTEPSIVNVTAVEITKNENPVEVLPETTDASDDNGPDNPNSEKEHAEPAPANDQPKDEKKAAVKKDATKHKAKPEAKPKQKKKDSPDTKQKKSAGGKKKDNANVTVKAVKSVKVTKAE